MGVSDPGRPSNSPMKFREREGLHANEACRAVSGTEHHSINICFLLLHARKAECSGEAGCRDLSASGCCTSLAGSGVDC